MNRSSLGSFSKPRRQRQRGRHQTKGLMSRTIAVHVRFESLYISMLSSAKQQREMTKFYVFWTTRTAMANLCIFFRNWTLWVHIKPEQIFRSICVLSWFTELRHSKVKYKIIFYPASSPPSPSSLLKLPIFKLLKTTSQILVSSLYTKMCEKISFHVIKNTTLWNVESDN